MFMAWKENHNFIKNTCILCISVSKRFKKKIDLMMDTGNLRNIMVALTGHPNSEVDYLPLV